MYKSASTSYRFIAADGGALQIYKRWNISITAFHTVSYYTHPLEWMKTTLLQLLMQSRQQ